MRDFLAITKALADETRLRLLLALRGHELCLCQLVDLVALAASTVSKHMSILRQARLVDGRKDGRWMYYRLADSEVPPAVRRALQWTLDSLANDRRVAQDLERLEKILLVDPQSLCASSSSPQNNCGPAARRKSATRARK